MNPPTQEEVINLLTRVRAAQTQLHGLATSLESARTFSTQCHAKLAAIGTPAATDEDSWLRVATLEKQRESSKADIAKIEEEARKLISELAQVLDGGGRIVQRLLWAPYVESRNKVSSAILPYCQSVDEARALAEQTSSLISQLEQLNSYATAYRKLWENSDIENALTVLETIEGPCAESLRANPLLAQFLATSATAT